MPSLPEVRVFENGSALIEDDGVDAVVAVSPDDTHAGLVMQCLERWKPVMCETPLSTSAAARGIVDAEAAHVRKLVQVGFMRRYDPRHVDVGRMIELLEDSGYEGWYVLEQYLTVPNRTVCSPKSPPPAGPDRRLAQEPRLPARAVVAFLRLRYTRLRAGDRNRGACAIAGGAPWITTGVWHNLSP